MAERASSARSASRRKQLSQRITFSVDSALLRELGERLVGQPHIALAELVKNSYDADATIVVIRFGEDSIEVSDNGHGMTFPEFRDYWMRIGSPHKQLMESSRRLGRPITGSKGVGRLAVQFLARSIELSTTGGGKNRKEIQASIDWDKAIEEKELTKVEARYGLLSPTSRYPGDSKAGTSIVLRDLNQDWYSDTLTNLAREIWMLQPPFRTTGKDSAAGFDVRLETQDEDVTAEFNAQMHAHLTLWEARMIGQLRRRANGSATVKLSLEYDDGERQQQTYKIPRCALGSADFEIRIYKWEGRQPAGIRVKIAREYFNKYGGVHVYDSGFHLPYYGADHDWLDIEKSHSHRLSRSSLLPDELQVKRGMTFLPTQSRIWGVVNVDTKAEKRLGVKVKSLKTDHLQIQVTRDRLVPNKAYEDLRIAVRWALDFYAMQTALRRFREREEQLPVEPTSAKARRIGTVLKTYKKDIPEDVYEDLTGEIDAILKLSESEAERLNEQVGLLGALATAGISAMAYEHEVVKQLDILDDVARDLRKLKVSQPTIKTRLTKVSDEISEWVDRARSTRALFSTLTEPDSRESIRRYRAEPVVGQVIQQMGRLVRGVDFRTDTIDGNLRLPAGRLSEFSAIFQNVILNSVNAMLDKRKKVISITSRKRGRRRYLVVQDTGTGVDPNNSEIFFQPFTRKAEISRERRELGLGGTGLGLTIVRMLANNLNANVEFVEPDDGFSTAFSFSWSETK